MLRSNCLLSVLSECRSLNSPKAVSQSRYSHATGWLGNLGPNPHLARANASPPKHKYCTCLHQWQHCHIADQINTPHSLRLSTHFTPSSSISYIFFLEKSIVAPSAASSRTGEIHRNCICIQSNIRKNKATLPAPLFNRPPLALLWLYNPGDCWRVLSQCHA